MGGAAEFFHDVGDSIADGFEDVGNGIVHGLEDFGNGMKDAAEDLAASVEAVANAMDDVLHGHFQDALNDMVRAETNFLKAGAALEKAAVDTACDAIEELHLCKELDQIAHDAKATNSRIAETAVSAVNANLSCVANAIGEVAHGDLKAAFEDVQQGQIAIAKGIIDVQASLVGGLCNTVSDLGIDPLSSVAGELGSASNKASEFAKATSTNVINTIGNDAWGACSGLVETTKDLGQGHFGDALGHALGAGMSTAALAFELTPEGLAATAAVSAMQTGHIGNQMTQDIVGGIVGGPKGLLQRVGETTAGIAVTEGINCVASATGHNGALLAGGAMMGAAVLDGRRGGNGPDVHASPNSSHTHNGPDVHASSHDTNSPANAATDGRVATTIPNAHSAKNGPDSDMNASPQTPPAWHEILGVSSDASKSEINSAFRKQSLQHHPDKGGDIAKQQELTKAREDAISSLSTRGTSNEPKTASTDPSAPRQSDAPPDTTPPDATSRNDASRSAAEEEAANARRDARNEIGQTVAEAALTGISTVGMTAESAAMIRSIEAQAASTMLAQSAIAAIQDQIALNQALNQVTEELGKGVKTLAQ